MLLFKIKNKDGTWWGRTAPQKDMLKAKVYTNIGHVKNALQHWDRDCTVVAIEVTEKIVREVPASMILDEQETRRQLRDTKCQEKYLASTPSERLLNFLRLRDDLRKEGFPV